MHLIYSGAILVGITLFGTVGYSLIEGWPLHESFYMTIISITTVGYQEVHPSAPWDGCSPRCFSCWGLGPYSTSWRESPRT